MPGAHGGMSTLGRRSSPVKAEPARKWYERFQLPASAWTTCPVQFIEIMVMVCPSASLPTILLDQFDQSTSLSALATGITDSVGGTLAFFLSPTLGRWSDQYGRKPLLIWLSLLTFLPIFCLSFYPYLNLWFYLSVRGLAKLSAFGILFSCIADVAPARQRARLFGQTSGLGMLAMVAGPLVSLVLTSVQSFRVCGGLAIVVMVYLVALMPETLWIGLRRAEHERNQDQAAAAAAAGGNSNSGFLQLNSGSDEGSKSSSLYPNVTSSSPADLRTSLLSASHHDSSGGSHDAAAPLYSPVNDNSSEGMLITTSSSTSAVAPPSLSVALPNAAVDVGVDASSSGLDASEPGGISSSNPCTALRRAFFASSVGGGGNAASAAALRRCSLVILFSQLSQNGVMECASLYLKKHLDFSKDDNSKLLLTMGSWAVVVLVVLMPLLLRKWREKSVLVLALSCDLIHQMLYLVIPNKNWMYSIAAAQGIGFVAYPASNAVLSKCVDKTEQGAVLAISAGIRSLTQGVAPLLFNGLLAFFTWDKAPYFPQAPFCLSAVCTFVAVLLAWRLVPTADELVSDATTDSSDSSDSLSAEERRRKEALRTPQYEIDTPQTVRVGSVQQLL